MDYFFMSKKQKLLEFPSHKHEFWEVLLNLEGEGIAVIDDTEYPFYPGTIFCIRPGVYHSKRSEEGFVDGSVLIPDFCFQNEADDVHVFQDDERQSFASLFNIALEYPMNPGTDIYAERFLHSIADAMQNLLRHWKNTSAYSPEVHAAQKLMADHVDDPSFHIDQIFRLSPYSPNHFRKLFREQCGCSPIRYFNQLRIQLAKKRILRNKATMSISEIASLCGFEDPYYFSRLFKQLEGISPMQYYNNSKTPPPPNEELDSIRT